MYDLFNENPGVVAYGLPKDNWRFNLA